MLIIKDYFAGTWCYDVKALVCFFIFWVSSHSSCYIKHTLHCWNVNVHFSLHVFQLKCEEYWPNCGSKKYGNIVVTASSGEWGPDFEIQHFEINEVSIPPYVVACLLWCVFNLVSIPCSFQKSAGERPRQITHYHYTSWPECGVPESPTALLKLHSLVINSGQQGGPILVHYW